MKKYNSISAGIIIGYLCMVLLLLVYMDTQTEKINREYLVEINQMMKQIEASVGVNRTQEERLQAVTQIDVSGMKWVKTVDFLAAEKSQDTDAVAAFYRKKNGVDTRVEALIVNGDLYGYVRFDYQNTVRSSDWEPLLCGIFLALGILLILLLSYIRNQILKPFHRLSEMPYELSRGHFNGEIEESKNRYFGRFTWGISMLRDELRAAKAKELRLEKEKKLLLLSISHDIKTPLGTIKLYAKAMEEGLYGTQRERKDAASSIQRHADEIELFVKEIVKNSSEDILSIEVKNSEFYLQEFADKIKDCYEPKCRLKLIEFEMRPYGNKLLKGDIDRAFEVIENLMENAFKYGDGKKIRISFSEEEYCQLIAVENTGMCVPEQEMPHLFDSFYRGSNVGAEDGNGLGLYICREIMRKMEGDIFAERGKEGMRFTVVIRE